MSVHRVRFTDHRQASLQVGTDCGSFDSPAGAWSAIGNMAAGFARATGLGVETRPEALAVWFYEGSAVVAEYWVEVA